MHKFVLIVDGVIKTYSNYDDIPPVFDHVIEFRPDVSTGPHTEDEHDEINTWNEKLQRLMEIERARSNSTR